MRSRKLEDTIQIHLVRWCRGHKSEMLHNVFHVPNGGYRDRVTASVLKAMGVRAGVPDLCLPLPGGGTYWLELKTKKGRLSATQKKFHEMLCSLGHIVETAYGFEDAQDKLEKVVKEYI
jgi:hypothetical protein